MLKKLFGIFVLASAVLGLDSSLDRDTVAVYWGQNGLARPGAQKRLSVYCENSDIDIILISFLKGLQNQVINLADSINSCQPINGTELVYCPQVEEDIIKCQETFGKTILLSIGGSAYNESGFSTKESASGAADRVWANFGPHPENTTAIRPFGKAVVDGFDFDFESPGPNLASFGSRLRSLIDMESDDEKLLLSAAPQCPFPDKNFGPLLNGSIYFDILWVQFYNNYCGVNSFLPQNSTQSSYNFKTWDKWATDTYPNRDVKVFVGIPGGEKASGTGYISGELLTTVINHSSKYERFGGVMIWEMTTLYENQGFLDTVTAALNRSSDSSLSTRSTLLNAGTSHFIQESDASAINWDTQTR